MILCAYTYFCCAKFYCMYIHTLLKTMIICLRFMQTKHIVIITLLTQVRKKKNGKTNFRPGIEPDTQRLGVQSTRHQAITQDKSLSPHSSLCTASGHWRICQPHTDRPPKSCAVRTPLGVDRNTSPSGKEPRWEDLLSRYYWNS